MMQEIIDKDGDKSISERPRHVVSDDVVQHLWFNGNQDRIYRCGREIGTLVASEVGLAFNPASKYAMQGEISRAVTLMRFSPNDGRLVALGKPPSWLADDILLNQDRTDVPQFTWNSVLCIESEQGLAACHEVLKEFSMIATLRDGYFGYGVYAQGVFCCSSIDDLKTMFADSPRRKDESVESDNTWGTRSQTRTSAVSHFSLS